MFGNPVRNLLALGEVLSFQVNRSKHFAMQFVEQTHRFERIKQALLRFKISSKCNWHLEHDDIFGYAFAPGIKTRLKGVAVRAAIPKELNDFNLAAWRFNCR